MPNPKRFALGGVAKCDKAQAHVDAPTTGELVVACKIINDGKHAKLAIFETEEAV